MEEVRERLPFCFDFVAVNCCIYMYLFASLNPVVLKETVMLTDIIEHSMIANCQLPIADSVARWSTVSIGNWQSATGNNLTVARHEAYIQRGKRGELRRLAATQNNQLNSSGA
jgi:hypothetical protein